MSRITIDFMNVSDNMMTKLSDNLQKRLLSNNTDDIEPVYTGETMKYIIIGDYNNYIVENTQNHMLKLVLDSDEFISRILSLFYDKFIFDDIIGSISGCTNSVDISAILYLTSDMNGVVSMLSMDNIQKLFDYHQINTYTELQRNATTINSTSSRSIRTIIVNDVLVINITPKCKGV